LTFIILNDGILSTIPWISVVQRLCHIADHHLEHGIKEKCETREVPLLNPFASDASMNMAFDGRLWKRIDESVGIEYSIPNSMGSRILGIRPRIHCRQIRRGHDDQSANPAISSSTCPKVSTCQFWYQVYPPPRNLEKRSYPAFVQYRNASSRSSIKLLLLVDTELVKSQ
jgi:hypothetical protein